MKKIFILSKILLGLSFCVSVTDVLAQSEVKNELIVDSLMFFDKVHDFGDITQGDTVEYGFRYENVGEQIFFIKDVITQCGCTAPGYSQELVAPGETGTINIKFDSKDKIGLQRKTIKVITSSGFTQKLVIYVNVM